MCWWDHGFPSPLLGTDSFEDQTVGPTTMANWMQTHSIKPKHGIYCMLYVPFRPRDTRKTMSWRDHPHHERMSWMSWNEQPSQQRGSHKANMLRTHKSSQSACASVTSSFGFSLEPHGFLDFLGRRSKIWMQLIITKPSKANRVKDRTMSIIQWWESWSEDFPFLSIPSVQRWFSF